MCTAMQCGGPLFWPIQTNQMVNIHDHPRKTNTVNELQCLNQWCLLVRPPHIKVIPQYCPPEVSHLNLALSAAAVALSKLL